VKLYVDRGGLLGTGPGLLGGEGNNNSRLDGVNESARYGSISDETEGSEEDEMEKEEHIYTNRKVLPLSSSNDNRHHTATSPTSNGLGSPIDESPETKRLKMSVNMLVS